MTLRIIIVGAGGQGAIVADALLLARASTVLGFVDDTHERPILDLPILGRIDALADIEHDAIVVAIGDNAQRRAITEQLIARGETLVTAQHPFTSIATSAAIGAGSMISAGAIVTPRATIGRGVLLNTKASVDHDSVVGDFAHVSAGATVGAKCVIGAEAMIGLGASVSSGCRVGARSVIGAGAVVVRDIPDDVVAYGVPARVMRRV
ncbi:MAG TPA: acetyltransferase [Thermoanaerobaculia bacterium]